MAGVCLHQKCAGRRGRRPLQFLFCALGNFMKAVNQGAEKMIQNVETEPAGKFPKPYRVYGEWFGCGIMNHFIKPKVRRREKGTELRNRIKAML